MTAYLQQLLEREMARPPADEVFARVASHDRSIWGGRQRTDPRRARPTHQVTRLVVDASALIEWLMRTHHGASVAATLPPSSSTYRHCATSRSPPGSPCAARAHADDLSSRAGARAYRDLPLTRHGHLALLPAMIALRDNFSAFDACYVALANRLDAAFLTGDRALARAVTRHTSISLVSDSSEP